MANIENKEESPEVRRSCYDCGWLKAYVSWWCTNPEAKRVRGTAIPGVYHCPYWKADEDFMAECRKKWKNDKVIIHPKSKVWPWVLASVLFIILSFIALILAI